MRSPILVWGCGGHGREVFHLCRQLGVEVAGALDERPFMKGVEVDGVPVLGDIGDAIQFRDRLPVFCAGVGDPALRKRLVSKTREAGFAFSDPLIHPGVCFSGLNQIGPGSMVAEGSILTVNIRIGAHVIVNRSVNIGHDCVISDFATLSPAATLSGNVTLEEGVYLGTCSGVREKLRLGSWSVVGGGAFVIRDVAPDAFVLGVPAREKTARCPGG